MELFPAHVMIVAGYKSGLLSDVEILDLSGSVSTCLDPADFPKDRNTMSSGFVGGRPLTCGGYNPWYVKECYGYSFEDDAWTRSPFDLLLERDYAASVVVPGNGSFLVLGGLGETMSPYTTEMLDAGGEEFRYGPDMPGTMEAHCAVMVNDTHLVNTNVNAFSIG